jgi:ABC-type antimicrobial peptide transport system permease subunit
VTLRLRDGGAIASLRARMAKDPRLNDLEVHPERQFFEAQSEAMSLFIRILGITITIVFSIGAVIGAMITMYASVANRTAEIGTLRALGFPRASILTAFLAESLAIALLGGLAGVAAASLLGFYSVSTVNWGSFSELAFGFDLSPDIAVTSLLFALGMGVTGGFLPAVRAARMDILTALRSS